MLHSQKLLEAVKAATEVTSRLSEGETKGLEELCAQFMDCIQVRAARGRAGSVGTWQGARVLL